MPLSTPQQSGDILKPADIQNHIMIVAPVEYIPHLQNVNTKPGEVSPAIRINVVDFSSADGVPVVYKGAVWFNQMLHGNLKRQIGEFVLGMMTVGQATPGRNAPFSLSEVTDAAWVAHCTNWLDNTADGAQFIADSAEDANRAANQAQVAQVAASAPPAPIVQGTPSAPPAPPAPRAAPVASAPPAPPAAPGQISFDKIPSEMAGMVAGPGAPAAWTDPRYAGIPAGLAAMIAQLPAAQQDTAIAVARGQAGAAS